MPSAINEHIKFLKILTIFFLCPFSINKINAISNKFKKFLSIVVITFISIIIMPISYYQHLYKNLQILNEKYTNSTIKSGYYIFFITGKLMPIVTIITYMIIGYFSIYNQYYHISLINELFSINKFLNISDNSLAKKLLIINLAYFLITISISIIMEIQFFNSILSLSYSILNPFIETAYLLEMSYLYYVINIITKKIHLFIHLSGMVNSKVLDKWLKIKCLYEQAFSEILIINGFFDFITMTIVLYQYCVMYELGLIANGAGYILIVFVTIFGIIPYNGKTIFLVKQFEDFAQKVNVIFVIIKNKKLMLQCNTNKQIKLHCKELNIFFISKHF